MTSRLALVFSRLAPLTAGAGVARLGASAMSNRRLPADLPGFIEWLAAREAWYGAFYRGERLAPDHLEEIRWMFSGDRPKCPDEPGKADEWARYKTWSWIKLIIYFAHHWLTARGMSGQPDWQTPSEESGQTIPGVLAVDHLRALLNFLRQKAAPQTCTVWISATEAGELAEKMGRCISLSQITKLCNREDCPFPTQKVGRGRQVGRLEFVDYISRLAEDENDDMTIVEQRKEEASKQKRRARPLD